MLSIRRSADRGHFDHGWLDTRHTFSFGSYHDRRFMGFRSLRVINEDRVQPGHGFPEHPHRDMEIITYVLEGELAHRDSLGNAAVIRPGDVQYMAAGGGILHSEFNPSKTAPVHLIQIWIRPRGGGAEPRYDQRSFPSVAAGASLRLLASGDGRDGSIQMNQDADLYAAALAPAARVNHTLAVDRAAWIQVLRGSVELDSTRLDAGDGAAVTDERTISLVAATPAELLLFDLA